MFICFSLSSRFALRALPLLVLLLLIVPGRAATGDLAVKRGKFEPESGCYIGAFIERDYNVWGDISEFEEMTQKKHASYITYISYGRAFPMAWVNKVRASGAAPHIAFEPNQGLDKVQDEEYLRAWARDAARTKVPIFLRWASEMNGPWAWARYGRDPQTYREKFRLVARVMREEAPNVAMVWTPFAEPQKYINEYYPGDEAVDWVGVNIYSVYVNNGDPKQQAFERDPVDFLRFVYNEYAARKPIHISEYAATVYCKGTAQETTEFAIRKMQRFYTALREEFPRVKAVQWFCLDTIRAGLANNNYSILDDPRVLFAYRELVKDPYFLSKVSYDAKSFGKVTRAGSTLGTDAVLLGGPTPIDQLEDTGAIAATLTQPMLRGVSPGESIRGSLLLRTQLPLGMSVQFMAYQIDGQTVALLNGAPYRVTIPRERFLAGEHSAKVIVFATDGSHHESPAVPFEIVD